MRAPSSASASDAQTTCTNPMRRASWPETSCLSPRETESLTVITTARAPGTASSYHTSRRFAFGRLGSYAGFP